jgi:hypothetical protein
MNTVCVRNGRARASGRGGQEIQDLAARRNGVTKALACFGLAGAAAIRAPGTGLELRKGFDALGRGAADGVIGNGIAHADVHGIAFKRECERLSNAQM